MDPDIRKALIWIGVVLGASMVAWISVRWWRSRKSAPTKPYGFTFNQGPRPGGETAGAGVGATKRPPPRSDADAEKLTPSDGRDRGRFG